VNVTLWGTRGSLPSAGPENVRYGGNTACVEVRGEDGTIVVLDAGTGVRRLGLSVPPDLKRIDMLLTHLHLDHIQGLGFFQPLYHRDLEVHIWGPPARGNHLGRRLTRYLSPPLFPVPLRDLPCKLALHELPFTEFRIGSLSVISDLVCHPGPTAGFRIAENGATLAYLPDHEPALGAPHVPADPRWLSGYQIARGVDLLIHDTQYADDEYDDHVGWGHSAVSHTLRFATIAGVKRLVTFHHDPGHSDAMLDRIIDEIRSSCDLPFDLLPGVEGATFDLDHLRA
jgi:phosphoribosyl 1,2-cyclic phosphodiesterase